MSNYSSKIIINPVGGLANRMRALASGLTLSAKLGCGVKIIWKCNWELNARIDDIFQFPQVLEDKISYPSPFTYGILYSAPRKRNFYMSRFVGSACFGTILRDGSEPLKSLIREDDFSTVEMLCRNSLRSDRDCLLQGGTNMYPYSPEFYRYIFKPSEEVKRRVTKVQEKLGEKTVGVHIRRTDNAQSIQYSPDSLFISCMDRILQKEPNTVFYLATDDEPTKNKFRNIYGPHLVVSETEADRSSVEGILEAATEMYLLASTDRIIGSFYSSFSEAAAMLGAKPLTQIYAKTE